MTASALSEPVTLEPTPSATPRGADRSHRRHQAVTLVAAVGLFTGAINSWLTIVQLSWTGVVGMVAMLAAMVFGVLAVTVSTEQQLRLVDIGVLVTGLCVLTAWATSNIYFRTGYGTDEAAFVHRAAELLLEGVNPYGANLLDALSKFRVPIQYVTTTMDGQTVDTLGYPPVSVLITAAFVPLTSGAQTVLVATAFALAVSMVLMHVLLPVRWKPMAVISCLGLPIMFGYSMGGMNTLFALPFLVVVATGWTRIGTGGALRSAGVVRAVCLGCAIATQQLVWFVTPFILTGIWLLRRSDLPARTACRVTMRFSAVAAAAFAVINLPFVVWNPVAWLHSVAEPLTQQAIPYGHGLIDLATFFTVGGGALKWFNYAGACIGISLFVLYVVYFRRLGIACWILPWICFYFPTRSLAAYFMILIPIWVVSLTAVDRDDFANARPLRLPQWTKRARVVVPMVLAPGLLCATAAVATPAPLRLEVMGVTTNGQLQSVWNLRVRATNTTSVPLRPRFAANAAGQASTMWNVERGPAHIPAHSTAEYELSAPNRGSMPGLTTPFIVQAFTADPPTVSSTRLFTPQPYSAMLNPTFVNEPQPAGQAVTFTVRLRSPFGDIVHKGGVRIALGQTIYGQNALIAGEARINGSEPGRSPVHAVTGPDGTATFTVRSDSEQEQPIYFQAWIEEPGGYPSGYSEIVSVRWTHHKGAQGGGP